MKVLLISNPTAMISLALARENLLTSSKVKFDLKRNFSSSVNWITSGTSNTSCNHLSKSVNLVKAGETL